MIKNLLLLICIHLVVSITAQEKYALIQGLITEDNANETVAFANITLNQKGIMVGGTTSDFDGNYKLRVNEGIYDIQYNYVGYSMHKEIDIQASANEITIVNITLKKGIEISNCGPWYFYPSLIKLDDNTIETIYTRDEIRRMPY